MKTLTLPFSITAIAGLAVVGSPTPSRAAPSPEDEIAALREHISQLDQKLRILERKQELREETAADQARGSVTSSADANGFALTSSDRAFRLQFRVLAQADSRLFFNEKRIPGSTTTISQNTFLLRRIRPIVAGTVGGIYEFNVTPEFGGGDAAGSSVALQDAWVSVKLTPSLAVKAGKYTSPVALEPGANRHFIESPFVNTLLPNRDIGVELLGAVANGFVDYRVGAYNGTRNNTAGFARDVDNDKSVAGRVTLYPFKDTDAPISGLGIGIGGSLGRDVGPGASALQSPVTNAQQPLLSYGGLAASGRHTRLSPSVFLYSGPFSFVSEYAWEKQELAQGVTAFTAENTAWRATVGYVLTGEDSTARGVAPRTSFRPGENWGAFELVGRVSGIDFDGDLFDPARGALPNSPTSANATGATAYGVGLNWFLSRNLALLFNYELTNFDGRTQRPDESAFFSRAQINF